MNSDNAATQTHLPGVTPGTSAVQLDAGTAQALLTVAMSYTRISFHRYLDPDWVCVRALALGAALLPTLAPSDASPPPVHKAVMAAALGLDLAATPRHADRIGEQASAMMAAHLDQCGLAVPSGAGWPWSLREWLEGVPVSTAGAVMQCAALAAMRRRLVEEARGLHSLLGPAADPEWVGARVADQAHRSRGRR